MNFERGLVGTELGYIHYRAAGDGPAIMLFHVNQQSSALLRELMEALAPNFRSIAIDYPSHGDSDHAAQFLICRTCGQVTEIDDHELAHALEDAAKRLGFTVGKATIEAEGRCATCARG